jgi:hypothetical protein
VIETPLLDKGNPEDLPAVPTTPDIRSMLTELVGKPYAASRLAADVLDGVALDRPIIVAPRHARVIWALYRAWPGLLISQSTRRVRSVKDAGLAPQRQGPDRH